ncbi:unnamed protein product [Prunus brigantina]
MPNMTDVKGKHARLEVSRNEANNGWDQLGKAKINIVKDNLLAITVANEYMAAKLLSVSPSLKPNVTCVKGKKAKHQLKLPGGGQWKNVKCEQRTPLFNGDFDPTRVKVYDNGLSGNIPSGMWTAPNLDQVLSNNFLTGELPEKLSRNLTRLEIRNNRFSGHIPTGVSSWNLKVFDAGNNLFNGTIPQELTALPSLMSLSLEQNQLTGFLPSEIISWNSLNTLNFSRNQLSGPIPAGRSLLSVLTALDLLKLMHIVKEIGTNHLVKIRGA